MRHINLAPITTDYLVIGAGASAMAFVDTLLSRGQATLQGWALQCLADPRIPNSVNVAPVGTAASTQYIESWQSAFEAPVPLREVLRISYVQFG